MSQQNQDAEEALILKQAMQKFLDDRLQEQLTKTKDSSKSAKMLKYSQLEAWLADAAHRAYQIQLATHAPKYMHPAIKGATSIYLNTDVVKTNNAYASTRSLAAVKIDAVGNAAVLDVYKFLQISHDNKTLIARIINNDPAIKDAFPGTDEQKEGWLQAFKNITQPAARIASHALAKQLYFPVGNSYHILAPLFPTSLAQAIFEQIQAQHGESAQAARAARKAGKPYPQGYRDYPDLMMQRFGGANKQNISQLNTNRSGKIYLLPSLPPVWKSAAIQVPLRTKNILKRFESKVRALTSELRTFLLKSHKNNLAARNTRAVRVKQICDEFLLFAENIQSLSAGWSKDPACQLPLHQVLWLDPGRAKIDEEWQAQRQAINWKQQVSQDFAGWLNKALEIKKIKKMQFSDAEFLVWEKLMQRELSLLKEVMV